MDCVKMSEKTMTKWDAQSVVPYRHQRFPFCLPMIDEYCAPVCCLLSDDNIDAVYFILRRKQRLLLDKFYHPEIYTDACLGIDRGSRYFLGSLSQIVLWIYLEISRNICTRKSANSQIYSMLCAFYHTRLVNVIWSITFHKFKLNSSGQSGFQDEAKTR